MQGDTIWQVFFDAEGKWSFTNRLGIGTLSLAGKTSAGVEHVAIIQKFLHLVKLSN
jgi:hypothetical protein